MTLWRGTQQDHASFSNHLAAERCFEEFKGGRLHQRWEMKTRINHWLDATYMACAAGHFAGWRLLRPERGAEKQPRPTYAKVGEGTQERGGEGGSRPTTGYRRAGSGEGGGGWKIGR